MNFEKVNWKLDDTSIRISVPFSKRDDEKRTVSGFASLDNIDSHGDIVEASASREAFANFRGNLREMHQHVAVGRVVDIQERKFYDDEGKAYNGIYVTARVSKGAQDTWEKVLDGTLSGFSIGGNIIDEKVEVDKAISERPVRRIKKYELHELSLVDNPANPLANVVSFEKVNDGLVAKGMVTEFKSENVFYCDTDKIAEAEPVDEMDCGVCDNAMTKIGWFEYTDSSEKDAAVAKAITQYLERDEGGVKIMPDEEKVEETTPEVETEEVVVEEKVDEEPVEEVEEADFEKTLSETRELTSHLSKSLEELGASHEETANRVEKINDEVNGLVKTVSEKFEQLENSMNELKTQQGEITQKFADLQSNLTKVADDVSSVQKSTAIKKSGDLGEAPEAVQKGGSIWGGRFLDVDKIGSDE